MTRKDYTAIAAAVVQARFDVDSTDIDNLVSGQLAIDLVVDRLAATLAADNPRFDRGRFIAACDLT